MDNRQKRKISITVAATAIVLAGALLGLSILSSSFTTALEANKSLDIVAPTVVPENPNGEVEVKW